MARRVDDLGDGFCVALKVQEGHRLAGRLADEEETQMNLTRREMLFAAAATLLPLTAESAQAASSSRLSVEGYIWQQYMASKGKKLGEGLDEIFGMARGRDFTTSS